MPQPWEHGQHATNLQLFISSCQVVPVEAPLGKPKEEALCISCSLDPAPEQCHMRKNIFQAVTQAWREAGGSLPSVLILLQIMTVFPESPTQTQSGGTHPPARICSALSWSHTSVILAAPSLVQINRVQPPSESFLAVQRAAKPEQGTLPTGSRHLTLAPPTAATEFCLETSKRRLECGLKGIWKIKLPDQQGHAPKGGFLFNRHWQHPVSLYGKIWNSYSQWRLFICDSQTSSQLPPCSLKGSRNLSKKKTLGIAVWNEMRKGSYEKRRKNLETKHHRKKRGNVKPGLEKALRHLRFLQVQIFFR